MNKVGLKLFEPLDYELFEPLQYWLDYEFEYDEVLESIEKNEVISLDLEEDEDRVEDLEMLEEFLKKLGEEEVKYELYVLENEWISIEFINII